MSEPLSAYVRRTGCDESSRDWVADCIRELEDRLKITDEMVERAWAAGVADLAYGGRWDKPAMRVALGAALSETACACGRRSDHAVTADCRPVPVSR